MLDTYKYFINRYICDIADQKILLAVSGGVDSMVMLALSIKAELDIIVAHVDHGMRGDASDLDALLVRDTCNKLNIPYHQYNLTEAEKSSASFQENARNIRYKWWNTLCQEHGCSHIFTAHHSSDSVETFFINLSRGAGIRGLTGIPVQNLNIFRPLSDSTKEDILAYAVKHNIEYREDESNTESKYKRNIVRNQWLPYMQQSDPDMEKSVTLTINNLKRERKLLDSLASKEVSNFIHFDAKRRTCIDTMRLQSENQHVAVDLLYQYLRVFGFTYDTCVRCLSASTGAEFQSDISELLVDRETLLLRSKLEETTINDTIDSYGIKVLKGNVMDVTDQPQAGSICLYNLSFPFQVRTRRNGDRFKPSGMNGSTKKVKDFLTDLKIDKWTKQDTILIEKESTIVAVLPFRISHGHDIGDLHNGNIYVTLK